jgi:nicotinic acid phosphoribosyltransferase
MAQHVGAEHAELLRRSAEAAAVVCPYLEDESADYVEEVKRRGAALVDCLGTGERIFEVGMRAAVTSEQHLLALEALSSVGIEMTSNVAAARELGLRPVGTMDDLSAFRAMRDMRGGVPSYLLDTFDTIRSGIPNAIRVMRERSHPCSIRYDSGDKFAQYMFAHGEFSQAGLSPSHILEDGLGHQDTVKFEQLREFTGLDSDKQLYGYGGYLVARPARNPLTRDRVAAVYKLGETSGEARMKFGNEAGLGKRSVPGRPVIWRKLRGEGSLSVIAQEGEAPPEDYVQLSGNPSARRQLDLVKAEAGLDAPDAPTPPYTLSPETRRLEAQLESQHRSSRK